MNSIPTAVRLISARSEDRKKKRKQTLEPKGAVRRRGITTDSFLVDKGGQINARLSQAIYWNQARLDLGHLLLAFRRLEPFHFLNLCPSVVVQLQNTNLFARLHTNLVLQGRDKWATNRLDLGEFA